MAKDTDIKQFDLQIRTILEAAGEEVPDRLWDGVCSRMEKRRRIAIWKWVGTGISIAAAVALFFVMNGSLNQGKTTISTETEMLADAAQKQMIAPEANASVSESVASVSAPSVTRHENHTESTGPLAESLNQEYVTDGGMKEGQNGSGTDKPASRVTEDREERTPGRDPLSIMAFEDSKKHKEGKLTFDLKGLVGTNDKAGTGYRRASMSAVSGKNIVATTSISETGESTYGVPITFGFGVKYHFAEKWSIGVGLDFSMLTRTFSGTYTKTNSSGAVEKQIKSENIRHNVCYVGIPVNFYFDIISNKAVSMYTFAGGSLEKGLSQKYTLSDGSQNVTWKQGVNGLQASADLGLGVQFNLTDNFGIYVDPAARWYFNNNQPKSIRTQQPLMFNLELGLRFDL